MFNCIGHRDYLYYHFFVGNSRTYGAINDLKVPSTPSGRNKVYV